ncbi:unnamed protein product [Phytophthora fragariaefolia]|uniref:Unnamed protein product n=1 Tax=Phytophthora fragariaefolia TaxID=1490495 RepID=A0A9W6XPM6_9STRA|nr:unnamed protein product [Phytophthora fragariaefolia]
MADGRDSNGWVNCNMIQVCFANEAWGVHPRTTTEELESKPTEAWFRHPRLASFPTFTTPTTYEQSRSWPQTTPLSLQRTCVSDRHLTSASSTDSMIDSTLSKSASTQSISSTTSWLEMNCRSGSPLPRRRVPLVQVALVDEPRHQAAGLNVAVFVRLVDVGVDNKREAAAEEVGVAVAEPVDEPRGHGVARPSSQPGQRTL